MWYKFNDYCNGDKAFVCCCYVTPFKSPNTMHVLQSNVYILPSISFRFNNWGVCIFFSWITFNAWLEYRNITKQKKYL